MIALDTLFLAFLILLYKHGGQMTIALTGIDPVIAVIAPRQDMVICCWALLILLWIPGWVWNKLDPIIQEVIGLVTQRFKKRGKYPYVH